MGSGSQHIRIWVVGIKKLLAPACVTKMKRFSSRVSTAVEKHSGEISNFAKFQRIFMFDGRPVFRSVVCIHISATKICYTIHEPEACAA